LNFSAISSAQTPEFHSAHYTCVATGQMGVSVSLLSFGQVSIVWQSCAIHSLNSTQV